MSKLFNTTQEIEGGIALFMGLKEHPAWKLIQGILEENLEAVREELEKEGGNKDDVDRLRIKISIFKNLIELPDKMISQLSSEDPIVPNSDPYPVVSDLIASRT